MGIDFIFLVLLVWYGFKGYRKGIVQVLFSSVAMIVAVLAAVKLSGKVSLYFFDESSALGPWVPMISFFLVFSLVMLFVFFVGKTVDNSLKKVKLGGLNRLAGMLVYAFVVSFIFSTVLWLGDKVKLIKEETKSSSLTYNIVAPIAPWSFTAFGAVLPFVKQSYKELDGVLDKINERLP